MLNTLFYGDNLQILRDLPPLLPSYQPPPAYALPWGNRESWGNWRGRFLHLSTNEHECSPIIH